MTGVQEGSNISSLNAGSNGNSFQDVDDISVMGIESSIAIRGVMETCLLRV